MSRQVRGLETHVEQTQDVSQLRQKFGWESIY